MNDKKGPTPAMKQFLEAKQKHPDAIILFRMGDFYETFDEDATLTSEILSITLTKRSNGSASSTLLAGFPYHSLDQHLHKLLKAGHRVAICEQIEDPKKSKGLVKRKVVEVLSPGTALSERYLKGRENNYLASLVFKDNMVGISIIDYSTGEFSCGEWSSSQLNIVLKKFNINEILISEKQLDLFSHYINDKNIFLSTFPDWIRDRESCYDVLKNHFKTNSLKGFGIESLDVGIRAAGLIIDYVSLNFENRINHITSISLIEDKGYMGLDSFTFKNLEIFSSLSDNNKKGSLISVIDKNITSGGSRLFKRWVRRPLTNIKKIKKRLMRVEEFYNNSEKLDSIREILKDVYDINRIIARLSNFKANPKDILNLGISLSTMSEIKKQLKSLPVLFKLVSTSNDLTKMIDQIKLIINNDLPANFKKGGVIKNGFSARLDELREISTKANDMLVKIQIKEQKITGIPSLKIGYNRVFGYYFEVTKVHLNKVPKHYIRKQTLTNSERFFTSELKEYENKILSASEGILELEKEIFEELCLEILTKAKEIQYNASLISMVDIASSLAFLALQNDYSSPQITNGNELILENARHPVVETLLEVEKEFIPNELNLDCKKNQIAIITGPNMAGKSTYLRQTGIIVLMAQIGSFVPASKAIIGVIDKLFTRVGASDNLAAGESTFLVEMNETSNILNNATNHSLIILDEIGRGTSTYDGLSIAWAVTEYIHNKKEISAKTLFATHYHELIDLANELPRAFNLNVAIKETGDKIIFLRKIIKGGSDKSYGIYVAEMAGLPKTVISRARRILSILSKDQNSDNLPKPELTINQIDLFNNNGIEIKNELNKLNIDLMTPLDALKKLSELKEKYDA